MKANRIPVMACGLWVACISCWAQTTQGLIAGRIVDSSGGSGVAGAIIVCRDSRTGLFWQASSSPTGAFSMPPLSPGTYELRIAAEGYQPKELHELVVPVAAQIELRLELRRSAEVLETGRFRSALPPGTGYVLPFFGPDAVVLSASVEAGPQRRELEASISEVIDPRSLNDLPLSGRDTYTMLAMQPGAAAEAATTRGVGLAVHGQRPYSANFLLDGLEENNALLSGPQIAVAPEAVQEYRVSTANYSAEYGRTAGFVANAVSRAGGRQWHGLGYLNVKNEALNANGFQENRRGIARAPLKENQAGYFAGGPLRKDTLFLASSAERLRSRGRQSPFELRTLTRRFLEITAPGSIARTLLERFPPPADDPRAFTTTILAAPPVSIDRTLSLNRLDYVPRGAHSFMARIMTSHASRPDFIWSPYRDFVSGMRQPATSAALAVISSPRPSFTNEFRLGWRSDDLRWDRAHPEIPTLVDASPEGAVLPGSLAFYAFQNRGRSWEFLDHLLLPRGRHIVKFGGGALVRGIRGHLTAGRDGRYLFPTVIDFSADLPSRFSITVARDRLPALALPDYARRYRYRQAALFVQDLYRATPRLTVNLGLRWDFLGAPQNIGPIKDGKVELGPQADIEQALAASRLVFPIAGAQPLYRNRSRDLALRAGASYDLSGRGRTVLRGGFGIFYDRPFDNVWQNARNNNFLLATFPYTASAGSYLRDPRTVLAAYEGQPLDSSFPALTLYDPNWKTGYAQSYFVGVQNKVGEHLALEVNSLGVIGRRLITTDQINRAFSLAASEAGADNPDRSYNPALPAISFRAPQGFSDYRALTAVARYRGRTALFQAAYTWSHTIDNQSEPLAGDFFDLNFARLTPGADLRSVAAFSRQFDNLADRGNADFDQRHNLVFFGVWDLPFSSRKPGWLLRGWKFALVGAIRSGFPVNALAPSTPPNRGGVILNNRPDMVNSAHGAAQDVPGGKRLFQASQFREPRMGELGNLGRNALPGPGLFSTDVSISRTITLGEAARMQIRADVYNALNHANLGPPQMLFGSRDFGVASYGRTGRDTGFPTIAPFQETPRQIQIIIRLEF